MDSRERLMIAACTQKSGWNRIRLSPGKKLSVYASDSLLLEHGFEQSVQLTADASSSNGLIDVEYEKPGRTSRRPKIGNDDTERCTPKHGPQRQAGGR